MKKAFQDSSQVLEIGSGTGQHAVFFAENLPHQQWQPSDLDVYSSGIKLWLDEAGLDNIKTPISLDVNELPWKIEKYDGVFSANTLHIMATPEIENLFQGIARILNKSGKLCIYGPFNYDGKYTSESNELFDDWLYNRNPKSAIRDFEWVNSLARDIGLKLVQDYEMPANNRLLEWERTD